MGSSRDAGTGDFRALAEQGLVPMQTLETDRESPPSPCSRAGKEVLEAQRSPGRGRAQAFHAAWSPREICHDSQLYRLSIRRKGTALDQKAVGSRGLCW